MKLKMNPMIIAICGPSGVGKTTIIDHLLTNRDDFVLSKAATTRKPRGSDAHNSKYVFVSKEEFESRLKNGDFVEYGVRYNNSYGELRSPIAEAFTSGKNVVIDIVLEGAKTISKNLDYPVVSIGILPPSKEI